MTHTELRIALLTCGSLTGKAYAENGDYWDVYSKFMHDSCPAGTQFKFEPFDVVSKMEYPSSQDEDQYDCMMLTGSAASAYENLEWINILVDYVARIAESKPNIKLIGICFGHQIIARALGSACVPNGGKWEVGPTPIHLTDLGRRIFGSDKDTLTIQQMHRDHVPSVPPNFHLLASTAITPNQGMVKFLGNPPLDDKTSSNLPPIQIITVQGHPEFTESVVSAIIEQRAASGVIDSEAAQDAEKRRYWKTDGIDVFGQILWDVILQAKHKAALTS
ncbi:class I glutamine amidotransferase-like protein [Crepidotus variabilis]|uniref:Class I glutamine amidotransferase-like protein n=1 Tax=Crepidotus variabilis TaxID=179855 RepID=A0A9P6JL73_9AGAR|nr:class I glutamine amidotransferase-like protein [Crepidotus variabilis]